VDFFDALKNLVMWLFWLFLHLLLFVLFGSDLLEIAEGSNVELLIDSV